MTKQSHARKQSSSARGIPQLSRGWRRYLLLAGLLIAVAGCPFEETDFANPNPELRLFRSMYRYPVGNRPFAVVAADFNLDGYLDLATANEGANSVSVRLARKEGGFDAHVEYAVGRSPQSLAAADFNGDDLPDLATANRDSDNVSILLGDGEGGFAKQQRLSLRDAAAPEAMVAADFDADGWADLATANRNDKTVAIFMGSEEGFADAEYAHAGAGPRSIAAADLDLDGNLDLVTANRNANEIGVLFGRGDGHFLTVRPWLAGKLPSTVAIADFNDDDLPDILVSNAGDSTLGLFVGQGNRLFAPQTTFNVDGQPTRMATADFDDDGATDVAVLPVPADGDGTQLGRTLLFFGTGTADFSGPHVLGTGPHAFAIITTDLDGDAQADLVTADTGIGAVSVVYGEGNGRFRTDRRFPVGNQPRTVALGDLNDDGTKDAVVANLASKNLHVLFNDGNAAFTTATQLPLSDTPRALALADLDADGTRDIMVTNLSTNRVSVFLGTGAGAFGDERRYTVRAPEQEPYLSKPRSVAIGDLNGDSAPDIVTGNTGTDTIAVLLGDGKGRFGAPTEFELANFPLDVHLVLLNGDPHLDLIFISTNDPENQNDQAEPRVVTCLGTGDGAFNPDSKMRYTTGASPRGLAVADFNADGNLDAVTVHPGDDSVYLLRGRGSGKLAAGERIRTGDSPNSVAVADVNADGRKDIVTTNNTEMVTVLLNRGDLNFEQARNYYAGSGAIGGALSDLDGDGKPELVFANNDTAEISVLRSGP